MKTTTQRLLEEHARPVRRPVPDRKFNVANQINRMGRGQVARTQAPADEEMIVPGQRRRYRPLRCWLAAFFIVVGPSLAAGQPTPQSTFKLVGTGAVGPTEQGWSVALSADGKTAIVGGIVDNGLAGAAWVYTRSNDGWNQQGSKLVGAAAVGQGGQGVSVALSADGSTAIVGGPNDAVVNPCPANVNPVDCSPQGAAWGAIQSDALTLRIFVIRLVDSDLRAGRFCRTWPNRPPNRRFYG